MPTEKALTFALDVALSDGRLPRVPFPVRDTKASAVILPKWVYIRDRDGRYLTVRSGPQYATLTFRSGDPDLNCNFETISTNSNSYQFWSKSGGHLMRWGPDPYWYSTDGTHVLPSFSIITARGNTRAYMKDTYGAQRFLSNELKDTGAPMAHDYINETAEMEILAAAIKNEIINVQYDISGAEVRDAAPLIVLSTAIRNDSDGDVSQTLQYTYEKWKAGTWNNAAGIEIGMTTSFQAGVPFIASAEYEISISTSYSHEWGGEEGVRETISSSTTVTVPPKKKARATIIVRNAQIDVGFTYTQRIMWSDGSSQDTEKTGIYTNVDSWFVDVELDNWEDI